MNFNPRYQSYKDQLPIYVLKRISDQMIKKYNINEANSVIDDLFEKYAKQYQKKRQYDKRYFEQDKTKRKELQHLQTENDRLKARVNKLLALNNQYKGKK